MLTPFDQTFELPLAITHPGKVFYVSDTGVAHFPGRRNPSDGNQGTFMDPYATIDYAIGRCVASRGDVIYVLPGHTETITTDGGIALDVAGVSIIGLGTGTLRPVVVLDAAAAAVTVSAANCTIKNFEFRASFADVSNAIDVTGTNFTLDSCEFTEEGANLNFVEYINASGADNTADNLKVINCVGTAIDAAQNSFVLIANNLDGLQFHRNLYISDHANTLATIRCATGAILTDCAVTGNYVSNLMTTGDIFIDNDVATNTGVVSDNFIGHADTASVSLIDVDGVRLFENYSASEDTTSGFLRPALDADS